MSITLPNFLSVLRLGLVPVFVIAVVNGQPVSALLVMALAGLTDALDGYFARYLHQQSLLGSYLDPIADKLLMTAAYVVLSVPTLHQGVSIPVWVTVLVITRDVIILSLALVIYLTVGVRRFPPTWLSKVNTVLQVVAVLLVLVSGIWLAMGPIARVAVYLVALSTATSGIQYGVRVARMSGEEHAGDQTEKPR